MRDQDYQAAYDKLDASERARGSSSQFAAAARRTRDDGRGAWSFGIDGVNTNSTNGVTTRTAGGRVTYTSGDVTNPTDELRKENGEPGIAAGYVPPVRSS